ncbi:MAG: hypothetical protein IT458_03810 [Planctomycetes bacterium]|nr:hypothetical protein [Planctomycetota bacterium]
MAGPFLTYRGAAELLSLGLRGVTLAGATLDRFDVLLVKAGTVVWPSSENLGSIAWDLRPGIDYVSGFLPRADGTWTVGPRAGSEPIMQARAAAPLTFDALTSFDLAGAAIALGTDPGSTLIYFAPLQPCPVSARQRVTLAGVNIGEGPYANATAFYTSHGVEVLLRLALNGTMPGGNPTTFGVGLLDSSYVPPAFPLGWSTTRADLSPFLLAPDVFDRSLFVPRAPTAWNVTVGNASTWTVAKPSAPLSFSYLGGGTEEVAHAVLFDGPALSGEPILVQPLDATYELTHNTTARIEWGGSQP